MVTAASPEPFISANQPVQHRLESGGRVLVLICALKDPVTNEWQDIRIERTGWFKWFRGSLKDPSHEEVEMIRKTYNIYLKTSHLKPGEGSLSSDLNSTRFAARNAAGALENKTSYAYKAGRADTEIAPEDAAYFHREHMTIHDAVVAGILNPLGITGANATSVEEDADAASSGEGRLPPLPDLDVAREPNPAEPNPTSKLPSVPNRFFNGRKFNKALEEVRNDARANTADDAIRLNADVPYDDLPDDLRKQRLIAYLDKVGPIPFSAVVENRVPQGIEPTAFQKIHYSLDQLAVRDALGKLAALEARTALSAREAEDRDKLRYRLRNALRDQSAKEAYEEWKDSLAKLPDAQYTQQLLEYWFRAAYHFLDKESTPDTTEIALQLREKGVSESKLFAQAKEIYWRSNTPNWTNWLRQAMPTASSFLDELSEALSKTKL